MMNRQKITQKHFCHLSAFLNKNDGKKNIIERKIFSESKTVNRVNATKL